MTKPCTHVLLSDGVPMVHCLAVGDHEWHEGVTVRLSDGGHGVSVRWQTSSDLAKPAGMVCVPRLGQDPDDHARHDHVPGAPAGKPS